VACYIEHAPNMAEQSGRLTSKTSSRSNEITIKLITLVLVKSSGNLHPSMTKDILKSFHPHKSTGGKYKVVIICPYIIVEAHIMNVRTVR